MCVYSHFFVLVFLVNHFLELMHSTMARLGLHTAKSNLYFLVLWAVILLLGSYITNSRWGSGKLEAVTRCPDWVGGGGAEEMLWFSAEKKHREAWRYEGYGHVSLQVLGTVCSCPKRDWRREHLGVLYLWSTWQIQIGWDPVQALVILKVKLSAWHGFVLLCHNCWPQFSSCTVLNPDSAFGCTTLKIKQSC